MLRPKLVLALSQNGRTAKDHEERNERQEVFLRASSHQLKTPITSALLLIEGKLAVLCLDRPMVINESDRIGIVGSNGAGKLTLVKFILGLTHYSGNIMTDLKPGQMAVHMQSNNYTSRLMFE